MLTAMVPELSYKHLDTVQDGGGAQQAYLKAIGTPYVRPAPEEIELIRKQLLAYCELDTLAMVKIWHKLTQTTDVICKEAWHA